MSSASVSDIISRVIFSFALLVSLAVAAPNFLWSSGTGPGIESATSAPYQPWPSSSTTHAESSTTVLGPTTSPTPTSSGNYACATVSSLVAEASVSAVPTIPAQIAWDCLQSVPLNATAGRLKDFRTAFDCGGASFNSNYDRNSLGAVLGALHQVANDDVLPEESAFWLSTACGGCIRRVGRNHLESPVRNCLQ